MLLHNFNESEEEKSRFFGLTSKKKTIEKERSMSTSYKFNESEEGNSRFFGLTSKKNTVKRMLEASSCKFNEPEEEDSRFFRLTSKKNTVKRMLGWCLVFYLRELDWKPILSKERDR